MSRIKAVLLLIGVSFIVVTPALGASVVAPDFFKNLAIQIKSGQSPLGCSLSGAWKYGSKWEELRDAYELGDWHSLSNHVLSTGWGDEGALFFLGRSAEGSGDFLSAKFFYEESIASRDLGKRLGGKKREDGSTICRPSPDLIFPMIPEPLEPLVIERLRLVTQSLQTWDSQTLYERQTKLAEGLSKHVAFHQCHRWAKGKSTEAIRKWGAAVVAGAVAGVAASEIVGGEVSRSAMAGFGVQTALSAQIVADVYSTIRFPQKRSGGSSKFEIVFPACMAENGLEVKGDANSSLGWQFNSENLRKFSVMKAAVRIGKPADESKCAIFLEYENQAETAVTPTLAVTLFSAENESLEIYTLTFPTILAQKKFRREFPTTGNICRGADTALISSAVDNSSQKPIAILVGVRTSVLIFESERL